MENCLIKWRYNYCNIENRGVLNERETQCKNFLGIVRLPFFKISYSSPSSYLSATQSDKKLTCHMFVCKVKAGFSTGR